MTTSFAMRIAAAPDVMFRTVGDESVLIVPRPIAIGVVEEPVPDADSRQLGDRLRTHGGAGRQTGFFDPHPAEDDTGRVIDGKSQ